MLSCHVLFLDCEGSFMLRSGRASILGARTGSSSTVRGGLRRQPARLRGARGRGVGLDGTTARPRSARRGRCCSAQGERPRQRCSWCQQRRCAALAEVEVGVQPAPGQNQHQPKLKLSPWPSLNLWLPKLKLKLKLKLMIISSNNTQVEVEPMAEFKLMVAQVEVEVEAEDN